MYWIKYIHKYKQQNNGRKGICADAIDIFL
jgi:hypothetical protein